MGVWGLQVTETNIIWKPISEIKRQLKSLNVLFNTFMSFRIVRGSVICALHVLKNITTVSAALNKIQSLLTHRFAFLNICYRVLTNKSRQFSLILFVQCLFVARAKIDSVL